MRELITRDLTCKEVMISFNSTFDTDTFETDRGIPFK